MAANNIDPALITNGLISKFDTLLSNAGIASTYTLINSPSVSEGSSILELIQGALQRYSLDKLRSQYPTLQELVVDIAAQVDEDSYFSDIRLPTLPRLEHDVTNNIIQLVTYVAGVRAAIRPLVEDETAYRNQQKFYAALQQRKKELDKGFFYEFTDGDLARIQQIINELRNEIAASKIFEEDHKSRLLRRLENLQAEVHKKMSDVDRIWGLVGDAGIALSKFGVNAKPIVDRIKELSQIAWRTQARREELPSDCSNPLLPRGDEKEG